MADLADLYDKQYWHGGSNYDGYGDDPGWVPTLRVLSRWLPPGSRVLELGCATGWFVKHARAAGYDCTGIDVSGWCAENAVVDTITGDACDLGEFGDGSFDAVVSWEFLEHQERWELCLGEMVRVTRPGGLMVHRIGLDMEGDPSWAALPDDDPTHVTMRPRWWWEERFARFSTPVRQIEDVLDREFRDRDWRWRFFARSRQPDV